MPDHLLLGPILRRVARGRATIWVQTANPATVEVTAGPAHGAARTFCAFGFHYALVTVDGLPADATTPYRVTVDGEVAWPPPGYRYPAPVIRTTDPDRPVRLLFGSCREASPYAVATYPPDALDAYAVRLAAAREAATEAPGQVAPGDGDAQVHTPAGDVPAGAAGGDWPDLLVLLGDQIYADQASPRTRRWLRRRRQKMRTRLSRRARAVLDSVPDGHVIDYAEYDRLYRESWTDPEIRWLLSTVPSVMIFDDHEIIDDWNTSQAWRTDMADLPWWRERITAGLASYWVYQHLGNLDPDALGEDPVYRAVTATDDATQVLRAFGADADAHRDRYRWSYRVDVGRTRVLMLDSRCGRQLEPGRRAMMPEREWDWVAENVRGDGYEHLVIGTSLPWLLPPSLHHVEAWNEKSAESTDPRRAAVAERIRRTFDLEHWGAFSRSFEAMAALLGQLGSGAAGTPPASISVLSGDVHHSYVARAEFDPARDGDVRSAVHQLTCSPVHNKMPPAVRPLMKIGWSRRAEAAVRRLARAAHVPPPGVSWRQLSEPYFGNAVGSLVLAGRTATVTIEGTRPDGHLVQVSHVRLS